MNSGGHDSGSAEQSEFMSTDRPRFPEGDFGPPTATITVAPPHFRYLARPAHWPTLGQTLCSGKRVLDGVYYKSILGWVLLSL